MRPKTEKVFGLSEQIGVPIVDTYAEFVSGRAAYLSCGNSASTDLRDKSVDAVITDPPFFDNVHYSELADFFYCWQRHILGADGVWANITTRSEREVQSAKAGDFTERLTAVWRESHRVLKDEGLLIFTYHHSRPEGWRCLLQSLMGAAFGITAAYPIKGDLSLAVPKHQAKEPITFDIILVCRKRSQLATHHWAGYFLNELEKPARHWAGYLLNEAEARAQEQVRRLRAAGFELSRNDVRVTVSAQLLRQVSRLPTLETALSILDSETDNTEAMIDRIRAGSGKAPNSSE